MRSLYELLVTEKNCMDRIETFESEMKSISDTIAELEAYPFDSAAKMHDIERKHELLSKTINAKEAVEKDLHDIRAKIRDYFIVIARGE